MTIPDSVLTQIVVSGFSCLAAVMAARYAHKASEISKQTHDAVNSRMDKFLKMAEESFRAQGKLEANEVAKKAQEDADTQSTT